MVINLVPEISKYVVVKNGYRILMEIYAPYRARIYAYNAMIKDSGYYLKPIHLVYKRLKNQRVKYIYFGRYWYRLVKKRGTIKWIYVGKDKPDPHLPDPPLSPFEGLSIIVNGDDIIVDRKTFNILNELSKLILKKPIAPQE